MELKLAAPNAVQLSIVIPAYNEQARLPYTVLETVDWCTAQNIDFELIVVDDGSRDETLALGRLLEETDDRIHVLACPSGWPASIMPLPRSISSACFWAGTSSAISVSGTATPWRATSRKCCSIHARFPGHISSAGPPKPSSMGT
jgi:glycosyltransferase involved in cell wall biosynthesis